MKKKPKPTEGKALDQILEQMFFNAEWGDAELRLLRLERMAREGIARKANMFRPLIHITTPPLFGEEPRAIWRTPPNANSSTHPT